MRLLQRATGCLLMFLFVGCAVRPQIAPNPETPRRAFNNRQLLVFLDGTAADYRSRTNVRRLYEVIAAQEDPARICFYSEGVGTTGLTGKMFGFGIKTRVMLAYEFLAQNYRPGDKIFVFGFSRGAHSARTLCGILAHAGLYDATAGGNVPTERIWDITKNLREDPASLTKDRVEGMLASNRQFVSERVGGVFRNVEITFLGLWDTVPGLQFTRFTDEDVVRKSGGDPPRYKIKAYPNVRTIAHALAIDEQRSKFKPLRVGAPLDPNRTTVLEVWFPGAHADVGGGYGDSNDLAGTSLNWMLDLLVPYELIESAGFRVADDPLGIAHHPEAKFPNRVGSKRERRVLPIGATIHPSFVKRAASDEVREQRPDGPGYISVPYRPEIPALPERARKESEDQPSEPPAPVVPELWTNKSAEPRDWQLSLERLEQYFDLYKNRNASRETGAPLLSPKAMQVDLAPAPGATPSATPVGSR